MNIVVTGGNGFIGRHIVRRLLDRGDSVSVLSRQKMAFMAHDNLRWVHGDIRVLDDVRHACESADAVIHSAATIGHWLPWPELFDTNVQGTSNIVQACLECSIRSVVYTSTASVVLSNQDVLGGREDLPYATHNHSPYAQSKIAAERILLEAFLYSGLTPLILRPHLVWGPGDTQLFPALFQRSAREQLKRIGKRPIRISVSYVENVADAHIQALDSLMQKADLAGEAYFVSDPQTVEAWDFINDILVRAGYTPALKSVPAWMAIAAATTIEAMWTVLRLRREPPFTRYTVSQLMHDHTLCCDKAVRDFSYNPAVSIGEGVRRYIEWLHLEKKS